MLKRRLAAVLISLGLAGCGGSGGSTPPPPPTTITTTQSIAAASGGSISATLNGESVKVTIPAGGLSADATVSLSVYQQSALPTTFQSLVRRTQSLPTGASFITGFIVSTGSATLTKAMSITATAAAPAAGTVQRLAAANGGTFGDVDTATYASGSVTNDGNSAYPGPTLATSSVTYAFYSVASANAAAAPTPVITVSGPASVAAGSQGTYTAVESGNGFPYIGKSFTFSADATIGSIVAATGVLTATSAGQLSGNVTAVDAANSAISGKLAVEILSSRPASVGDSLSYTGKIATVITNYAIATPAPTASPGASPAPAATPAPVTQSQSGTVTESVSVTATPAAGQVTVASDEIDAFQLSSLETKTTSTLAYVTSGSTTAVSQLSTVASDSNGSSYETDFTSTSGLLTVLPETAGTFGPNDASRTYKETDPGITGSAVTDQRTTATDGSYTDTLTNIDGSSNVATGNADLTGQYLLYGGFYQFLYPAPASGAINITAASLAPPGYTSYGTPQTLSSFDWIPSTATAPYAETDSIATNVAFDAACSVPAKYGTTGNLVTESSTSIDPVFGTIDQQTTKSFDVTGVGTVCIELSDTTQTFYDYSGQEGLVILSYSSTGPLPILTSTSSETLTLASAKVAGQPVSTESLRQGASAVAIPAPLSHAAVASIRNRFVHAARYNRIQAVVRLSASLRRSHGGVR